MRRSRILVAVLTVVAIAGVLVVANVTREGVDPRNGAYRPVAGDLIWSDEFDGPAGAAPDPSRWQNDVGGGGWGNDELQRYTEGSTNASLDGNGNLVIEAREDSGDLICHYGPCRYTSARLQTSGRFGPMYGRIEARIKVPAGTGLWPAFWMLGDDIVVRPWPASGEIDVMEHVGHEPAVVKGSAHGPGYSATDSFGYDYNLTGGVFSENFHTFAVDWTPDRIIWSVDENAYGSLTRDDLSGEQQWVFDKPFFLLLNMAVGGVWPGPPDDSTVFPARMLVDYVRVYDLEAAAPGRGPTDSVAAGQPGHLLGYAGNCLDVQDGAAVQGSRVHLWDCLEVDSQRWTLENDQSVRALDLCLAPVGGEPQRGAVLEVTECTGASAQRFTHETVRQGLVNVDSGLCLDVVGFSAQNGAPLQLWDCAGKTNQRWSHTA